MKLNVLRFITVLSFLAYFFSLASTSALAYGGWGTGNDCEVENIITGSDVTTRYTEGSGQALRIKLNELSRDGEYSIHIRRATGDWSQDHDTYTSPSQDASADESLDFTIDAVTDQMLQTNDYGRTVNSWEWLVGFTAAPILNTQAIPAIVSEHIIDVYRDGSIICSLEDKKVMVSPMKVSCSGPITISQNRAGETCTYIPENENACVMKGTAIDFKIGGLSDTFGSPLNNQKLEAYFSGGYSFDENPTVVGGDLNFSHTFNDAKEYKGWFLYDAGDGDGWVKVSGCAPFSFIVRGDCRLDECVQADVSIPEVPTGSDPESADPFSLCKQASKIIASNTPGLSQFSECEKCVGDPENVQGVWTAVGCIKTEPQAIIQTVVKIGIGLGGGIALLMTLVGGFLLTTSQGDPKRTQEGKDMITSSVIGIVFVLFSVVILQFIGVTVLRLPGFGGA